MPSSRTLRERTCSRGHPVVRAGGGPPARCPSTRSGGRSHQDPWPAYGAANAVASATASEWRACDAGRRARERRASDHQARTTLAPAGRPFFPFTRSGPSPLMRTYQPRGARTAASRWRRRPLDPAQGPRARSRSSHPHGGVARSRYHPAPDHKPTGAAIRPCDRCGYQTRPLTRPPVSTAAAGVSAGVATNMARVAPAISITASRHIRLTPAALAKP